VAVTHQSTVTAEVDSRPQAWAKGFRLGPADDWGDAVPLADDVTVTGQETIHR